MTKPDEIPISNARNHDEEFVTKVADLGSTKEMLANGDNLRLRFAHIIREARRLCDLPPLE